MASNSKNGQKVKNKGKQGPLVPSSAAASSAQEDVKDVWKLTAQVKEQLRNLDKKLEKAEQTTVYIPPDPYQSPDDSDSENSTPFHLKATRDLYKGHSNLQIRFMHEKARKAAKQRYLRSRRETSEPAHQFGAQSLSESSDEIQSLAESDGKLSSNSDILLNQGVLPSAQRVATENGAVSGEKLVQKSQNGPPNRVQIPRRSRSVNTGRKQSIENQLNVDKGPNSERNRVLRRPRVSSLRQQVSSTPPPPPTNQHGVGSGKPRDTEKGRIVSQMERIERIRHRLKASKEKRSSAVDSHALQNGFLEERTSESNKEIRKSAPNIGLPKKVGATKPQGDTTIGHISKVSAEKSSTSTVSSLSDRTVSTSRSSHIREEISAVHKPVTKKRRPPIGASKDDEKDQSAQKDRNRPYDSTELRKFMEKRRMERQKLLKSSPREERRVEKVRHYDQSAVQNYIRKRKEQKKKEEKGEKNGKKEEKRKKLERFSEVLERQKERSTVPTHRLLMDGPEIEWDRSPEKKRAQGDTVELIRKRHEERKQQLVEKLTYDTSAVEFDVGVVGSVTEDGLRDEESPQKKQKRDTTVEKIRKRQQERKGKTFFAPPFTSTVVAMDTVHVPSSAVVSNSQQTNIRCPQVEELGECMDNVGECAEIELMEMTVPSSGPISNQSSPQKENGPSSFRNTLGSSDPYNVANTVLRKQKTTKQRYSDEGRLGLSRISEATTSRSDHLIPLILPPANQRVQQKAHVTERGQFSLAVDAFRVSEQSSTWSDDFDPHPLILPPPPNQRSRQETDMTEQHGGWFSLADSQFRPIGLPKEGHDELLAEVSLESGELKKLPPSESSEPEETSGITLTSLTSMLEAKEEREPIRKRQAEPPERRDASGTDGEQSGIESLSEEPGPSKVLEKTDKNYSSQTEAENEDSVCGASVLQMRFAAGLNYLLTVEEQLNRVAQLVNMGQLTTLQHKTLTQHTTQPMEADFESRREEKHEKGMTEDKTGKIPGKKVGHPEKMAENNAASRTEVSGSSSETVRGFDETQMEVLRMIAAAGQKKQESSEDLRKTATEAAASAATAAVLTVIRETGIKPTATTTVSHESSKPSQSASSDQTTTSRNSRKKGGASVKQTELRKSQRDEASVAKTAEESSVGEGKSSIEEDIDVFGANSGTDSIQEAITGDQKCESVKGDISMSDSVSTEDPSSSAPPTTTSNSWKPEKAEFGGKLVSAARDLAKNGEKRAEKKKYLMKQRMDALKNYFAIQIAVIHAQRRLFEVSGDSKELEIHKENLEKKRHSLVQQYKQQQIDIKRSFQTVMAERDFVEKELREIGRLQALTLHQQWELERIGQRRLSPIGQEGIPANQRPDDVSAAVLSDAVVDRLETPPIDSRAAVLEQIEKSVNPEAEQKRLKMLEKRKINAERMMRLRQEFERQEKEVRRLEEEAWRAWQTPPGRMKKRRSIGERLKSLEQKSSESSGTNSKHSTADSTPRDTEKQISEDVPIPKEQDKSSIAEGTDVSTAKDTGSMKTKSVSEEIQSGSKESKRSSSSVQTEIETERPSGTVASESATQKETTSSETEKTVKEGRNSRRVSWPLSSAREEQSLELSVSDGQEIESRIRALKSELSDRRKTASRLKSEYKLRTKEHFLVTEQSLQRQILNYDRFIHQTSSQLADLEQLNASGVGLPRPATPPRILSPRPPGSDSESAPGSPRRQVRSPVKTLLPSQQAVRSRSGSLSDSQISFKASEKPSKIPVKIVQGKELKDNETAGESEQIESVEKSSIAEEISKNDEAEEQKKSESIGSTTISERIPDKGSKEAQKSEVLEKVELVKQAESEIPSLDLDESRSRSEEEKEVSEAKLVEDEESEASKSETSESGSYEPPRTDESKKSLEKKELIPMPVESIPEEKEVPQKSIIDQEQQTKEKSGELTKDFEQLESPKSESTVEEEDGRTENDVSSLTESELTPRRTPRALVVFDGILEEAVTDIAKQTKFECRVENVTTGILTNLLEEAVTECLGVSPVKKDEVVRKEEGEKVVSVDERRKSDESPRSHSSSGSPRSPLADKYMAIFREPHIHPEKPKSPEVEKLSLDGLEDRLEDQWMEDDFGLSLSPKEDRMPEQAVSPKSPKKKLDLDKFTTDIFSAVPCSRAEVAQLVEVSTEKIWEQRRYGESIRSTEPPANLFVVGPGSGLTGAELELSLNRESDRAYRLMLFEWTKEICADIFETYENLGPGAELKPWQKAPRLKLSKHSKKLPRSAEELSEVVKRGMDGDKKGREILVSRRKLDKLDGLLLVEMYEEEADWLDYDKEEEQVKTEMAEEVWKDLLNEAITDVISL